MTQADPGQGGDANARLTANPLPHILVGLLVVLVMFGGLGTWAALAPLKSAVIAPGVVTVFSKRKTLQHLEGGIVSEILVRDGDFVERGELLLRLEDTRARANLSIIAGQLSVFRAREARLTAERDRAEAVVFPPALAERGEDPKVAGSLRGEAELFAARKAALEGEVEILTQRVQQLETEITGLEAQRRAKGRQLELIVEEVEGLQQLYAKGYAPRTRILALQREAERLAGERGEHIAEIARAKTSIGEAELQKIQVAKTFREEVVAELREVQARVFDLEERHVAAADELKRVELRAPQAGTVVGLDVHTVGGVISPGQPILDLVPREDELVIEGRVAPQDIDKVAAGLPAVVRLSAFDLRTTPELTGTVFTASADSLADPATGESYYLVGVRIAKAELDRLGDLALLPGMPAEVFIATGERTAMSYLIKPLTDGLERALRDE